MMPAISRELCGSHCFGGDSFATGAQMRPVGDSVTSHHPALRWSVISEADGQTDALFVPNARRMLWVLAAGEVDSGMWAGLRLTVTGACQGSAGNQARFSRALYAAWEGRGDGDTNAWLHLRFAIAAEAIGESDALNSVWRSIYSLCRLSGRADVRSAGTENLFLDVAADGNLAARFMGVSLLHLHTESVGENESRAGINIRFAQQAKSEGAGIVRLWPLRLVEGMGLPLPVPGAADRGPSIIIRRKDNHDRLEK